MKKLVLIPILLAFFCLKSQDNQKSKEFPFLLSKTINLKYLIYTPDNYEKSDKLPLLIYLHGSGERGTDLELVKTWGPPQLIKNGKKLDFIVVSPQCPSEFWWTNDMISETVIKLIDNISNTYKVDKKRIYLTGNSMGGYGTWKLAIDYPEKFAAIAPICGAGDTTQVSKIKNVPVWAFHGDKDPVVPVDGTNSMIRNIKKAGGNPKVTIYNGVDHNSWTPTYDNPELYIWLLQQKLK